MGSDSSQNRNFFSPGGQPEHVEGWHEGRGSAAPRPNNRLSARLSSGTTPSSPLRSSCFAHPGVMYLYQEYLPTGSWVRGLSEVHGNWAIVHRQLSPPATAIPTPAPSRWHGKCPASDKGGPGIVSIHVFIRVRVPVSVFLSISLSYSCLWTWRCPCSRSW